MKIYRLNLKIYLLQNIHVLNIREEVARLIDDSFKNEQNAFHLENKYKLYCFNSPFPLAENDIYKKGQVYNVQLTTCDEYVRKTIETYFSSKGTPFIKALEVGFVERVKIDFITKLYAVTPVVIKTEQGYWRNSLNELDYIERLRCNLIKKYNQAFNTKIDENTEFVTHINFKNKVPVKSSYKDISLLGDKIEMEIAGDDVAQKLACMAIAAGLGEMNARGYGFVGYKTLVDKRKG